MTKEKYGHAIDLRLHTRTPVTTITAFEPSAHQHISSDIRWTLTTPRGAVHCSQVVHATNAYASHLLPHLAGESGIIPVRGQVLALRVPEEVITPQYEKLSETANEPSMGTSSWGANFGFEYWFPRSSKNTSTALVILGGGRDTALPHLEEYTIDDSQINHVVGRTLRGFLNTVFPGPRPGPSEQIISHEETATIQDEVVEMEWVRPPYTFIPCCVIYLGQTGIMGFTRNGVPFVGTSFFIYKYHHLHME